MTLTPEQIAVDSCMSGETVKIAEWLWINLPIRHQTWDSLTTAEKAIVCHSVERIIAYKEQNNDRP